MDYIFTASTKHLPGVTLDNGPYQLNDIYDVGEEDAIYTYIVEPLGAVLSSYTEGGPLLTTSRLRILALLSDPPIDDFEVLLPSLDFNLNPALESFLCGNPSPRIIHDCDRDFLIVCVGTMHEAPIYAVTEVTFKRRNDVTSGLLTLREAFRFSLHPVFLTQEFSSYSLRQHCDFGSLFLPNKGLRFNGFTRKQKKKRDVRKTND